MADKEYIEREALLKEIEDFHHTSHIQSITKETEEAKRLWRGVHGGVNYCRNAVIEAPAADVVEVRRGEWIMRGGRFRCSRCDAKALWRDTGGTGGFSHEYEQVRSDFCYACGADMRGKTDDHRTEN